MMFKQIWQTEIKYNITEISVFIARKDTCNFTNKVIQKY